LALVERGMTREEAYGSVQRAAMDTWETGTPFRTTLLRDEGVARALDGPALDAIMDPQRYLVHTGTIFKRLEALETEEGA
jgi:adenylosuccinate lyase